MGLRASQKGKRQLRTREQTNPITRQKRKKTMPNDIQYEIILYWSKEDQAFLAEVPELPGCAADGPTYQEALANVQVIIREWIETAREMGRTVPEPRGRLLFA
jgi:predicted RNase H-like HicB family nuclease